VIARERKVLERPLLSSASGLFLKYLTYAYLRDKIIPNEMPSMIIVKNEVTNLSLYLVPIVVPKFSHKISSGSGGSSTIGTFP
jgi:hypothetical protein